MFVLLCCFNSIKLHNCIQPPFYNCITRGQQAIVQNSFYLYIFQDFNFVLWGPFALFLDYELLSLCCSLWNYLSCKIVTFVYHVDIVRIRSFEIHQHLDPSCLVFSLFQNRNLEILKLVSRHVSIVQFALLNCLL